MPTATTKGADNTDSTVSTVSTDSSKDSEAIADLVGRFYRGFAGGTDELDDAVTEDWEDLPSHPGQAPGPAGIKPVIRGLNAATEGLEIVVHDVIDGRGTDGNGKVAVRAEMRGTQTGELMGAPGTGRRFGIALHEFHEIRGGRIARTWHLEDWHGFLTQAGSKTGDAK